MMLLPETIEMIGRIYHGNYMDPIYLLVYLLGVINAAQTMRGDA